MARIKDFKEYDAIVQEKETAIKENAELQLERLLEGLPEIKKIRRGYQILKKRSRKGQLFELQLIKYDPWGNALVVRKIISGSAALKAIEEEERKEIKRLKEIHPDKESYLVQAYETFFPATIKENLSLLANCGASLYLSQRNYLTREEKESLYSRLLDQVASISKTPLGSNLETEVPELERMLNQLFLPEMDSQLQRMKTLLDALQEGGYVSERVKENLTRLISPQEERPLVEKNTRKIASSDIPSAPVSPQDLREAELEKNQRAAYLKDELQLSQDVAEKYAKKLDSERLRSFFNNLRERLGYDSAVAVVNNNPELLNYCLDGNASSYLKVLKQVQGRLSLHPELKEEFDLPRNLAAYASLESLLELKGNLYARTKPIVPEERPPETLDVSRLKLAKYTMLHQKPEVERRLSSLIETGSVTVEEVEHWNNSSGARAANILKKMKYQLIGIFEDLGLEKPGQDLNFGQRILQIDPSAQERLREIRDQAYELQRKPQSN